MVSLKLGAQREGGLPMTTRASFPARAGSAFIGGAGLFIQRMIAVAVCLLLAGCSSPSRVAAVPHELADRAVALGDPGIRTWYTPLQAEFLEEFTRAAMREQQLRKEAGDTGPETKANFLAISGGGANGAYGAGLLCGWTARGDRPTFKLVTGISTGALTAPFAFLGPEYDERLRNIYTSVSTREIAKSRGMLAVIYDDAMMDTAPLRSLAAKVFDEQMMRDIAREYAKGRLLFVLTTNLDANRAVIWNIGAIASSGDPGALALIHKILVASAAIPGAFPPVMIDVTVDGVHYQEMHVDGGAKGQVFLYPPSLKLKSAAAAVGITRERAAYIIRNSRLDPEWASVQRKTLSIIDRAIDSLIQTQGIGDLYRIYLTTQRDGVDYNLAFIPATFNVAPKESFDPVYMKALFDVGYRAAANGYEWSKVLPGFASGDQEIAAPAGAPPTGQ